MNRNLKEINFEKCKHRIVIYHEKFLNKNTIENKFQFLLSFKFIFLNDRIVTHLWNEKKTFYDLFAKFASLKLYALIKNWIQDKNYHCYRCNQIVRRVHVFEKFFIFHLAIRCDFEMMLMIKNMRTFDNIKFTSNTLAWHFLLNTNDAFCLHIVAKLNKLIIVQNLLLQKLKTLNKRFESKVYTLMHVIAHRLSHKYFQNFIKFLMNEICVFRVDMHAKTLNEMTSLKTVFSDNMINANSIYSLLSFQDQDSLNFDHLLNIIVNNKDHEINIKINKIRLIIIDNKIDMTNAQNSLYIAVINTVAKNWDQKFTKTTMIMWKTLIADRVFLNYFDDHDITSLIFAIEKTSLTFLENLDILKKNDMKQLSLNFLTFDKDGDIFHILAQLSNNRSVINIVEKNIERQSRMLILNHDSRSTTMTYLIKHDFEKCLKYLNQLSEFFWK